MTREELAAQIFCSLIKSGKDEIDCEDCFSYADQFLAYTAKQREPKVVECEHRWNELADGRWECIRCKAKPEPPKPERVAKEWNIYRFDDGTYRAFSICDSTIPYVGGRPPTFVHRVREVMND